MSHPDECSMTTTWSLHVSDCTCAKLWQYGCVQHPNRLATDGCKIHTAKMNNMHPRL